MPFTDKQNAALSDTLDPKHVKAPPAGKYGSYVEGWHVIAEANRIFGFDGWSSRTELTLLSEREVSGKYRVDYRAKVTITVHVDGVEVQRDGCGFGQGIDKDIGQAHESALKEAETDARKRALMTFGNPFGLALYDKTKANVRAPMGEDAGQLVPKVDVGPLDGGGKPNREWKDLHATLKRSLQNCATMDAMREWEKAWADELNEMPEDYWADLKGIFDRQSDKFGAVKA